MHTAAAADRTTPGSGADRYQLVVRCSPILCSLGHGTPVTSA